MPFERMTVSAWVYLWCAALPLAGSTSSQASSSYGFPLKKASASLLWHLATQAIAFWNAFTVASEHFRWSLVSGTQPGSSDAHVGLSLAQPPEQPIDESPPLKQRGTVVVVVWANAPPTPSKKMPPIATPRMPFMSPPPLGCRLVLGVRSPRGGGAVKR